MGRLQGSWLRRVGIEVAAVGVPAVVAVMGVPPFTWSAPAALVACALLPLRHLWPPRAVIGVLGGRAGGLGWPPALVALYTLGRRG
ncbi:MAG: sensor histidine kinase, partial [Pseudonocardia sp.]|nr:sensor histidine kinase [Pseudonocardia sp.]